MCFLYKYGFYLFLELSVSSKPKNVRKDSNVYAINSQHHILDVRKRCFIEQLLSDLLSSFWHLNTNNM